MLTDRPSLKGSLGKWFFNFKNRVFFRWLNWVIIGTLVCCLSIGLDRAMAADAGAQFPSGAQSDFEWDLPRWVPRPVVPADNPMNPAKVELGRRLFYDSRLSATGEFSCASCHVQALAFSDGAKVSVGATGEMHPRNSMSLTNVAYNSVQTWANPLMQHLEQQLLVPIFGENPVELGLAGKETALLQSLQNDADYRALFSQAFEEQEAVSVRNVARAIAAFERTMVSFNSPYDRYRYGGDGVASPEENRTAT